MGRHAARDAAFKALFWVDCAGGDPQGALAYLGDALACSGADLSFAGELVHGVVANQAQLDDIIATLSREWQVRRMPYVDRNVMRLALYEMLHRVDIPASVAANEAVELAKMYGGEESGRFVNGIIGQVAKDPAAYGRVKVADGQ